MNSIIQKHGLSGSQYVMVISCIFRLTFANSNLFSSKSNNKGDHPTKLIELMSHAT